VGPLQAAGTASAVTGAGASTSASASAGGPEKQPSTDEDYEDVFEDDDDGYQEDFD
jgi:hypothetical protein